MIVKYLALVKTKLYTCDYVSKLKSLADPIHVVIKMHNLCSHL